MNLHLYERKIVLKISKILILVILFVLANKIAFSKNITLKFASYGSQKYYIGNAEKQFLDEIEKQTNGKVQIQSYYSLFKSNEVFDCVSSGKVELGRVNIAYYPKRLILNSAIYLFQRGPTRYDNIMWVYNQIYNELPALNNEFKQFNQKIIYTYANLPTAVFFNKPVNSFHDFKGKRIRCASRWALEILKGIGAVPITTSVENLYEALRANAIEGVMTTYGATHLQKFEGMTKHIFIARELWTPIPFHITVNLDAWKRLPKEEQKSIETAAIIAQNEWAKNYLEWFEWFMVEHKKMGRTIVFASDDDINTWMQQPETSHVLNQWQAEAESAGYQNAKILLERIQKIIHDGIERDKM